MNSNNADPIWYPFTQMKTSGAPIHIERAKDCTLFGKDGKTYIDAISSWWVNIHGHTNAHIASRIAAQALELEHVIFAGFTHTPAIELAKKLIGTLPDSLTRIFYSDNGSTAVEVAIKMALQFWHNQGQPNKTKIIAFNNAYHGDTFGAMSVGSRSAFNAAFEKHLFSVDHIPVPNSRNFREVKEQLLQLLESGQVAAFIFEPLVQGASGMLMHEPEYLDELIQIVQGKNALCIADEVMTGFGRTGKNFAVEYLENQPDIICLSKGITGGFMPLGVTSCTDRVFNAFYSSEPGKTFFHGHSYTANPLACSAAIASLELLLKPQCQSAIATISEQHRQFADSIRRNTMVKEVRQRGTIMAIELNTEENTSYFNNIRDKIYMMALEEGVLLRPLGNILYVMPPYCITAQELDKIYHTIRKIIFTINERQ